MNIDISKVDDNIDGTKVTVKGMPAGMDKILSKNTLKPDDERLVCNVPKNAFYLGFGAIISESASSGLQVINDKGIFVGGMYVCDNKEYAWGYNASPSLIKMPEGRNFVDTDDIRSVLEDAFGYIGAKEYWLKIFETVKDLKPSAETDIRPWNPIKDENKPAIRSAWLEIFDNDTVIEDDLADEVKYRGGKIVKKTKLLESLASSRVIPSSAEFLERYANSKRLIHKYDDLSDLEKAAYRVALGIIKHVTDCELVVYTPLEKEKELGFQQGKTIGINKSTLRSCSSVIDVLVEELTHAKYNTSDMSREHTDKIRELCVYWVQDAFMMRKTRKLRSLYKT